MDPTPSNFGRVGGLGCRDEIGKWGAMDGGKMITQFGKNHNTDVVGRRHMECQYLWGEKKNRSDLTMMAKTKDKTKKETSAKRHQITAEPRTWEKETKRCRRKIAM